MIEPLTLAALCATAALFGAMLFFSFVVAPLVFVKLDGATAGRFIRELFPWYYAVIVVLGLLAALALAVTDAISAVVMGAIFLSGLYTRQILMRQINAHRDRMAAGDARAGVVFNRLHTLSVIINAVQLLAVLGVLIRLGFV